MIMISDSSLCGKVVMCIGCSMGDMVSGKEKYKIRLGHLSEKAPMGTASVNLLSYSVP